MDSARQECDATLAIARWAHGRVNGSATNLVVGHEPRSVPMPGTLSATGEPLVSNGLLGADVVRLPAGAGFAPHTHPGDHVLIVVAGRGTITYNGSVIPTSCGEIFLVDGGVPHAVGAISDHVLLAVGSPHRKLDAPDRMALAEYEEILAPDSDIKCLICGVTANLPTRLHDLQCSHCPCLHCVRGAENR